MDCPSGPSTIQSVGTIAAGPIECRTSRCHTCVITTRLAIRLIPNMA